MEAQAAKTMGFGERVAHGPFTLSLTLGQLAQRITHNWQVGVTDVCFTGPVRIGDTLTPRAVVQTVEPKEGRGFVGIRIRAVSQTDEDVMTGVLTLMLARHLDTTGEEGCRGTGMG